jgi:hypothetical protein
MLNMSNKGGKHEKEMVISDHTARRLCLDE